MTLAVRSPRSADSSLNSNFVHALYSPPILFYACLHDDESFHP